MNTKRTAIALLAAPLLFGSFSLLEAKSPPPPVSPEQAAKRMVQPPPMVIDDRPLMQIALLLDTSNSMDGLINQAKTQLWAIVNELAETRKHGQAPRLEVALYEYGNNNLSAQHGYIRQVVPLTTDLDHVSEALFTLTTNGGSEHCGQVIDHATRTLGWKPGDGHYKAVFIAGNEPFTQGPVHFAEAVSGAMAKDILVNTIHCGEEQAGIHGKWQHAARLGRGNFMTINQDQAIAHIHCPQDKQLIELNQQLNDTYIGYGDLGRERKMRQLAQDANAASLAPQANSSRIAAKSKGHVYRNAEWDLVDAITEGKVKLEALEEEALPAEMKSMNEAERADFVTEQTQRRAEIQAKIKKLTAERATYLAEQQAAAAGEDASLGNALSKTALEQAESRGFESGE